MRLPVLLPLLHIVLFASVVRDQTTTGTGTGANSRTFGTADQAAHHGTAYSGAADDLGLRVVPRVMVVLLAFGLMV